MNTSEEFILMCEKAIELQSSHRITDDDDDHDYWYIKNGIEPYIWLPRQDQLQEMIRGDFIETCDYIAHYPEKFVELKTPEKILLNIVMEENHHKKWDGKNWIAIE
uniref:Uncharacterized protein n=1 Tax=viral metagenome TaxID=1070528 RepID=A0A6H1ZYL6_9ZZZZ